MRTASVRPIACLNVIVDWPLETGPLQVFGAISTRSGCGSVNAPLARWPGSPTVSAASPAVLTTFAVVVAVYSRAWPGRKAPNDAGGPSVRLSVAGTVAPTGSVAVV